MADRANIDELDGRLIATLSETPRIGVQELSNRLGVTRATVYSRLEKLESTGVLAGFGPDLDFATIGYAVTAFITIELQQGRFNDVIPVLEAMPHVIEAHALAGEGDIICRVAAESTDHLMKLVQKILSTPGVRRSRTAISLEQFIRHRTLPLVLHASGVE
ncbi:MAG: Lrp/AsnC family transcriptional regulator [Acidimicrobiia bacterium]|nr:Lrp/AsnC family transcriptional regulator [Acidimicrobiia bacterium]MDX2465862.1 Lrp/AsnC family transcriptional regulator [Acidimicrobiia bacterium]